MLTKVRTFRNPDTFFGRFVTQFALGFSACLVAVVAVSLLGRLDLAQAALWSVGFSILFGLIRATLASPGTSFWGSPFAKSPAAR